MINFFNTVYLAIERSRGHAKKILKLNMAVIVVKLALRFFEIGDFSFAFLSAIIIESGRRKGCFARQ